MAQRPQAKQSYNFPSPILEAVEGVFCFPQFFKSKLVIPPVFNAAPNPFSPSIRAVHVSLRPAVIRTAAQQAVGTSVELHADVARGQLVGRVDARVAGAAEDGIVGLAVDLGSSHCPLVKPLHS